MKPRARIVMVDDDDVLVAAPPPPTAPAAPAVSPPATKPAPPAASAPAPVSPHGRFHALCIIEGVETGDKRIFMDITWRDLPLPLMADDRNNPEHQDSLLIGNFDRIEKIGAEVHGWGNYLSAPSPEALNLINLVKAGDLHGLSADIDDVEFEVLFPVDPNATADPMMEDATPLPTEDVDGVSYEVMSFPQPLLRVTEGRLMGATALPFPALQEAWIENDAAGTPALAAAAHPALAQALLTGIMVQPMLDPVTAAAGTLPAPSPGREASPTRFQFPDIPPVEWFEVPETPGPMPLTILDSGQVFGHLAVWGECHVGIGGECVEPPVSASNYARFHVGEIPVAPDGRVATGRLTFATGHADTKLGPDATKAHYDNTGTVAADIVAVDGDFGIWVCGAARSSLTLAQTREVMASPPSGDWRRFGRDLELVGALCVNVPGFNVRRDLTASAADQDTPVRAARVRRVDGQVTSLIVSHPAPALTAAAVPTDLRRRMMARIAASVGRTPNQRRAELRARVHGGT